MRLSRDPRDLVAHHLVLAKLQSDAVVRQLPGRPEEAARIAAELSGTAESAVRELRSTAGLLRREDDADGPGTPGVAQLPGLAASFGNAGLFVTVTTEGEPGPLSAGADVVHGAESSISLA